MTTWSGFPFITIIVILEEFKHLKLGGNFNTKIWVSLFVFVQDGNDYGEDTQYKETRFLKRPVLTVTLFAAETPPFIRFHPKLEDTVNNKEPTLQDRFDCSVVIVRLLTEIVAACKMIPRVEKILFPGN